MTSSSLSVRNSRDARCRIIVCSSRFDGALDQRLQFARREDVQARGVALDERIRPPRRPGAGNHALSVIADQRELLLAGDEAPSRCAASRRMKSSGLKSLRPISARRSSADAAQRVGRRALADHVARIARQIRSSRLEPRCRVAQHRRCTLRADRRRTLLSSPATRSRLLSCLVRVQAAPPFALAASAATRVSSASLMNSARARAAVPSGA
jgi:hypothetical protein